MSEDSELLREGARLFNEGEFYEAHEVWEDEWRDADGVDREFLHGLIQTAAVYVHLRRDNPEGVRSLARSALQYLDGVPSSYRGVDVDYVRGLNREAVRQAEDAVENDSFLVLREPRIDVEG